MRALDIISAKRDKRCLTDEQIDWFIGEYATGDTIADEQAAALAMAIYLNGMGPHELSHWTSAMIDSGERVDLGHLDRPTVDKHSTGGVGDKLSLIVVPLVAACGAAVPQLSGRGLGHTGGTLDKMEAISGWSAQMSSAQMQRQLATVGAIIAGASSEIAPADRKLYALRDVTGTIESIPLIASSIMSKKIAEGTAALTLDVKFGSGAFMKHFADAKLLAQTMVDIGHDHGVTTSALLTAMDTVMGRNVGNALEVAEAVATLQGHGPDDVTALAVELAREMLFQVQIDEDPAVVLASGQAHEKWEEMVAAQGGDLRVPLPVAASRTTVVARESGYVDTIEALAVGTAAWRLGAGRARKEDAVDLSAGIVCLAQRGDRLAIGDPVFELHHNDPDAVGPAMAALQNAIVVSQTAPPSQPVVATTIRGS